MAGDIHNNLKRTNPFNATTRLLHPHPEKHPRLSDVFRGMQKETSGIINGLKTCVKILWSSLFHFILAEKKMVTLPV